jgi:hypothetical protein
VRLNPAALQGEIGMNMSKHIRMTAAAAGLLVAGIASAGPQTFTTTGTSTDWRDPAAWTTSGSHFYPISGDTVNVNHDVEISNADQAAIVNVASGVLLFIDSGQSLTLDSSGTMSVVGQVEDDGTLTLGNSATATISGELYINSGAFNLNSSAVATVVGNTSSSLGRIRMEGTAPQMTIASPGGVVLQYNSGTSGPAKIDVDNAFGMTSNYAVISGSGSMSSDSSANMIRLNLTQGSDVVKLKLNGVTLEGAVLVKKANTGGGATATFRNEGFVIANNVAGDVIKFDNSLTTIEDTASSSCATSRWQSTKPGGTRAILELDVDASLASDFLILGSLDIDGVTPTTSGNLDLVTGACIHVFNSGSFGFTTQCGGGNTPPANPVTAQYCP